MSASTTPIGTVVVQGEVCPVYRGSGASYVYTREGTTAPLPGALVSQITRTAQAAASRTDRTNIVNAVRAAISALIRPDSSAGPADAWAALVFDSVGQSILAPLIEPAELPALGITLHLRLDAVRQPLPGVPVVYFAAPTDATVTAIAQDIAQGMYGPARIIFTSAVSRQLLEKLAVGCGAGAALAGVQAVVDGHVHIAPLDAAAFAAPRAPLAANADVSDGSLLPVDPDSRDLAATAASLVAALAATGAPLPTAIAPADTNSPAGRLLTRIREAVSNYVTSSHGWPVRPGQAPAPTLLITDRVAALGAALATPWTYGGLVQDVLGLEECGVRMDGTLMPVACADTFWRDNCASDLQDAIKNNSDRVDAYSKKASAAGEVGAEGLAVLMQGMPEMQRQKASIDAHTNVLRALSDAVQASRLDKLHVATENLSARPGRATRGEVAAAFQELVGTSTPLTEELRVIGLRLLALLALSIVASGDGLSAMVSSLRPNQPLPVKLDEALLAVVRALDGDTLAGDTFYLLTAVAAVAERRLGAPPADAAAKPAGRAGALLGMAGSVRRALGGGSQLSATEYAVRALAAGRNPGVGWRACRLDADTETEVAAAARPTSLLVLVAGAGSLEERARLAALCAAGEEAVPLVYGCTAFSTPKALVDALIAAGRTGRWDITN